ncbi:MAG: cell division protein ZapA [Bradymonadia bacterium]
MSQTHLLHIAGQRITVRSNVPSEHVQALAAIVDQHVQTARGSGASPHTAALMAALGFAGEVERLREENQRLKTTIAQDVLDLADTLDALAAGEPPMVAELVSESEVDPDALDA